MSGLAQEDSTVAARLREAGAVLIGKTNVAMMLADYQSSNPIFGRTNNPWNVQRTPGGSGGGAAAALAAGMTPFEIGTDLSSSIRIPAHFCGVFGLKPTENRVPVTGLFPNPRDTPRSIRTMSSIGPMARSVDDQVLLFKIIAGRDGRNTEVRPGLADDMPELDLKKLRIAAAPTFPGFPVAADIRDAVEDLARRLEQSGAVVNYTGHPAVVLPYKLDRDGLPIGLQLVAKRWDDLRLLAIAKALSPVTGGFRRPPGWTGKAYRWVGVSV